MDKNEIIAALLEDEDDDVDVKQLTSGYRVKYLVFATGTGPYGGGGWSRNARHRPQPEIVTKDTNDVQFVGKSVIVNGVRRLKCNVWNAGGKPIRTDYPDLRYEA